MRTRWFLLLGLAGCAAPRVPAFASPPGSAERVAAEAAIGAALDDFHDAAARADEPRYFAHLAPNAVFLGTDGTERWTKDEFRAYAHPFFNRGKAWNFHATARHVTFAANADIVWFDESLATARLGPARGSGVLFRDAAGHWQIAQYNLSIPIPNERFDEVKKLIAAPPASASASASAPNPNPNPSPTPN